MGAGRPKAFLELGGEPLLLRAARAFDAAPSVSRIVAVVPEAEIEAARALLAAVAQARARVVAGGERRQDSVLRGPQAGAGRLRRRRARPRRRASARRRAADRGGGARGRRDRAPRCPCCRSWTR